MNQKVVTVTVNIDMDEKTLDDKVYELEKLVEALDGWVYLNSGSLINLPIKITLFIKFLH